jgi:hypothetical protein
MVCFLCFFFFYLSDHSSDIEREAIVASRIGRMYNQVFKIPKKAQFFYREALDLGISLQPRNVTLYHFLFVLFCFVLFCFVLFCFVLFCFVLFLIKFMHEWYLEAQAYLQDHQAKFYTEEDAKDNAWKAQFLTEIEV